MEISYKSVSPNIPTPLATAGIGLFLAAIIPGGLTGGQGFVIGLFAGFAISILVPVWQYWSRLLSPLPAKASKRHESNTHLAE